MVEVAGLLITEQQVKQATHVQFGQIRGHALVQEVEAAVGMLNLIGQTWTGKVLG